ncbi:uncharacterized protein LOC133890145 [Phragmites australis]|uniref:uncharacterized protein LOC133890145 n=1 Tax=Phragmites australis TaxID=29695 RepID=UPI002D7819F1|nr:uncharacterized protein LOC133890145 [Phragmites australis]
MRQRFLDEHEQLSKAKEAPAIAPASLAQRVTTNRKISSPGDSPDEVKARIRYWRRQWRAPLGCAADLFHHQSCKRTKTKKGTHIAGSRASAKITGIAAGTSMIISHTSFAQKSHCIVIVIMLITSIRAHHIVDHLISLTSLRNFAIFFGSKEDGR